VGQRTLGFIDKRLRQAFDETLPFGGKNMLFLGDDA
jgi:hypothetical protein